MEVRALREADDRLAVSWIYEESWKTAYNGIIPRMIWTTSMPGSG